MSYLLSKCKYNLLKLLLDEGVGADAAVDEDEEMHDSGNEDEDADFEGTYCDHISIILFCFLF